MESIDVSELGPQASQYIARAEAGERIAVTEGGKTVAYLVAADERPSVFDQLVAAGQVKLATGDIRDHLPPPPMPPGARSLTDVVLEMRDEERW